MYDNTSRVIDVDINEILPNRFQPRIQFDEEEILELSDSIKEHGVIQPIVVRTIGDKYEIIAGERRYKASVLAGKETVPVIVRNLNDKDSAEVALIENVQRKNLTPVEEALSYKKILDMGYITQEQLAHKLGKSQSSIANKIRLLNLSDEVQEALLENKISERHARSLLKLKNSKSQNDMLNRIISERLTVRRTDEEIEKLLNSENNSQEGNSDSQKIIEKGEIEMNNNVFGTPSVPQNSQPTFDIFGAGNPVQQPVQTFDIFANNNMQVNNSENQVPSQNPAMGGMQFAASGTETSAPTPVAPAPMPVMGGMQFDGSGTETSVPTPVAPAPMPAMGGMQFDGSGTETSVPTLVAPAPMPAMGGMQFAANGTETSVPTPVAPAPMPAMGGMQFDGSGTETSVPTPVAPVPTVQELSPIIENPIPPVEPIVSTENAGQVTQQSENLFSFGTPNPENNEFKMPEPIIVTDYSKQYDPVMPQPISAVPQQVEFKEVISAIRECANKIEQYGYKIDVEEYDLSNLYQVVFKVEK